MTRFIDLRSDTVTSPTSEMRRAMAEAEVGDDVFGEDPTVNHLQARAAEVFEKESALFVPTGTMGNQIAVKLHTSPGQEIVVEARGHIFNYEMATMAVFSGCLARPVHTKDGCLRWSQIEAVLSPDVYYRSRTGLVALENTHNMAGGMVMSAKQTQEIVEQTHAHNIPVHLDGARIFNAAAAAESTVADLSRNCDSVMFCLSKGLSAPVGSLLVGGSEFILEARRARKMMGGGMRQAGILAAAGLVALETMPQRLQEDHENAHHLAECLQELDGLNIQSEDVLTNIVIVNLERLSSAEFLENLKKNNILAGSTGPQQVRFVTHKDVSGSDIASVVVAIQGMASL